MPHALRPNQREAMGFVFGILEGTHRVLIPAVNDDCYRENRSLIANTSIVGGLRHALVRLHGKSNGIVTDNVPPAGLF